MNSIYAKSSTYIDFGIENNDKEPKFKVGDRMNISKFRNILAKGYTRNWSGSFVIKIVKNTLPWKWIIIDLKGEKFTGTFYK